MTVELNHIIVPAHDKHAAASFLADILGVPVAGEVGPFVQIKVDNHVALDYMDSAHFGSHHCAFLVSEDTFDAAFARIRERGITFWADPGHQREGEINHRSGGRGCYFADPGGHNMEILTVA